MAAYGDGRVILAKESVSSLRTPPTSGEERSRETNKLPKGICTVGQRAELSAITAPTTELVIWERSFPRQFQVWLDQLDSSSFQNLRVLIQPDHLPRAIKPHLDECDIGAGDMRDFLIKDIGELISVFAGITNSRLVDVRLDVISHDACWKFHRDWVERRLLTTYRGPTTEWVRPQYAARAMSEQKRFTGPVEQLQENSVAIFKGSCASSGKGIVHRSPPIEGSGFKRLLLCLNQQSDVSPEAWSAHL